MTTKIQITVELPEITCAKCERRAPIEPLLLQRLPAQTRVWLDNKLAKLALSRFSASDSENRAWQVLDAESPKDWIPVPNGILCPECYLAWKQFVPDREQIRSALEGPLFDPAVAELMSGAPQVISGAIPPRVSARPIAPQSQTAQPTPAAPSTAPPVRVSAPSTQVPHTSSIAPSPPAPPSTSRAQSAPNASMLRAAQPQPAPAPPTTRVQVTQTSPAPLVVEPVASTPNVPRVVTRHEPVPNAIRVPSAPAVSPIARPAGGPADPVSAPDEPTGEQDPERAEARSLPEYVPQESDLPA